MHGTNKKGETLKNEGPVLRTKLIYTVEPSYLAAGLAANLTSSPRHGLIINLAHLIHSNPPYLCRHALLDIAISHTTFIGGTLYASTTYATI